jgi:hypothetical protein
MGDYEKKGVKENEEQNRMRGRRSKKKNHDKT